MHALLIVNPHATAVTERRRALLSRALAGATTLRTVYTERRGHATELAAAARASGVRLVVVHGGDGTVNETVNGLLAGKPSDAVPLLTVVPAGSTNVFARAVGIDRDPTTATEQILDGLARGSTRTVSVGLANDRYFTFNAGLGLDAQVVREVEDYRDAGHRISNSLHIRRAVRVFFAADRRTPALRVHCDGEDLGLVHLALISNVDPWTYAGARAVHINPGLPADRDLGLFALRSLGTARTLTTFGRIMTRGDVRSKGVIRVDSARDIVVEAAEPTALQVDGDYLGQFTSARFSSVPNALRVIV